MAALEHPPLAADAVTVGSDDELARALRRATANAQILIRAGTRLGDNHEIGVEGVLVRPEQPLSVDVTGEWMTTASNVMLHGLRFAGGKFVVGGYDVVVRRCEFTGWQGQAIAPVNGMGGLPKGGRMRLDYCTFHEPAPWTSAERKSKSEPSRVAIRGRSNRPENFHAGAILEFLHFYDLPEKCGPGYFGQTDAIEPVPDGPSHPNVDTGWVIRWILIERHRGGDALIDLKGGGFICEDITVLDSGNGRIDSRMGSGNQFRRIWPADGAGMDISGSRHLIEAVQLDGGTIRLVGGSTGPDVWKRPGGSGLLYQQVCDTVLRAVTGRGKIVVGNRYPASKLPVLRTRIEGCTVPVQVDMAEATTTNKVADRVCEPARKLTAAEVGIGAAWPGEVEPPKPGEWHLERRQADGKPWPRPWFFVRIYQDLPDFTLSTDRAARYGSRDEAMTAHVEVGRYMIDPARLMAVEMAD